jgi:hypothetical protein
MKKQLCCTSCSLYLVLLPSHPIFYYSHKLTPSYDSAITPASNVIVNQKWLNLVTEEHALDRTIGVITKTDRIEEADHEIVRIIHAILIFLHPNKVHHRYSVCLEIVRVLSIISN